MKRRWNDPPGDAPQPALPPVPGIKTVHPLASAADRLRAGGYTFERGSWVKAAKEPAK